MEESESEDDKSTESQEPPKIQEKKMKSQRNKKSVITVHEEKPLDEIKQLKKTDFKQYFVWYINIWIRYKWMYMVYFDSISTR